MREHILVVNCLLCRLRITYLVDMVDVAEPHNFSCSFVFFSCFFLLWEVDGNEAEKQIPDDEDSLPSIVNNEFHVVE